MSVQDTLNSIEKQVNEDGFNGTLHISCEDYGVIKKALELQIPKKPILGNTFSDKFQKSIAQYTNNTRYTESQSYKCPVCQKNIIMLWEAHRNEKMYGCKCKDDFCKKCGQALDWE